MATDSRFYGLFFSNDGWWDGPARGMPTWWMLTRRWPELDKT
jgi:hypothetical protein